MENKHKLDNNCKITYILYGVFLIYPLQSLIKVGVLSTDIKFFEIVSNIEIGYSIEFYAFESLFLLMLYIGIKSDLKNIEIFEDEDKLKKLKKSTLLYKLFITINIICMISLVLFTKGGCRDSRHLIFYLDLKLFLYCFGETPISRLNIV